MSVLFTVQPNFTFVSGKYNPSSIDIATRFRKAGYNHSTAYKSHAWDGYTRLFKKPSATMRGYFPTGLLQRVIRVCTKQDPSFKYEIKDLRIRAEDPPPVEVHDFKEITLREHQVAAGNAMLKVQNGILWAATNSGKTEIAIAVAKSLNLKTLFLVKGKDLVSQTYERFQKRIGESEVGIISATKWDVRKYNIASADTLSRRLILSATKKDCSTAKARRQQVIELLTSVDVMFIDECHTAASEGLWNVGRVCTASYRYGLSGTPFKRGDKQDLKLVALTGEIAHRISNREMIESGVSVPVEITMVDIDHPAVPTYLMYDEVYDAGVVSNDYRNNTVIGITKKYLDQHKQILILVKQIEHGTKLSDLMGRSGFFPHEFIHGGLDKERDVAIKAFKAREIRVLISSVILDVGVDIPNIDVLILAGGGKSHIRSLQRIGRGLRTNPDKDKLVVYDFADMTHPFLSDHSYNRLNHYIREEIFTIKNAPAELFCEA